VDGREGTSSRGQRRPRIALAVAGMLAVATVKDISRAPSNECFVITDGFLCCGRLGRVPLV
jgi:hypothetical protein